MAQPRPSPAQPEISFPADQENPFQNPFCQSDVVFIVEGQKLHVHTIVLSLYSPVFRAMFSREFAEKEACEIELKEEVKCEAMVQFLKMMYPVHSHTPIASKLDKMCSLCMLIISIIIKNKISINNVSIEH